MSAADLADLLDPARERVKLVTVAACWSAAVTAVEQRRLLGLPVPDQRSKDDDPERSRHPADGGSASGAVATELASRLGCAVLAMRYPVGDEFAMALTGKLYDLLARQGQPLPRAIGITLRQLLTGTRYPALSVATPALFGGTAADLRVIAPDRNRPENYDTAALKMAGFPAQPERFVGRTGVMARASAALASQSGVPGVLLHGMPGGGKTACALELAYGHEHAFDRLVWYKAPDDGMDITGALTDFALTLERYLDGFQMIDILADPGQLAGFLPRLTELVEQRRLQIVIDNAESLLTEGGQWRDARWGQVVNALTAHTGLLVRAGMAAVPYLVRQEQWTVSAGMLERAFNEDPSRSNAAAMLPAVQQMASHDPTLASVLARVLHVIDPAVADAKMRAFRQDAVARGDYRAASVATGELINHCRSSGRLAEALTLADEMIGYSRQAGLGPWTQLSDDLRVFGAAAPPPTDVTDLCRQLSDISGTDLADLLHALSPHPDATDRALRDLIAQAQALAAAPPDDDQR